MNKLIHLTYKASNEEVAIGVAYIQKVEPEYNGAMITLADGNQILTKESYETVLEKIETANG